MELCNIATYVLYVHIENKGWRRIFSVYILVTLLKKEYNRVLLNKLF
jgi:hypothetical protein